MSRNRMDRANEFKPAIVVVTSKLPLGSSLGSSAAFSSALLSCSNSMNMDVKQQGVRQWKIKLVILGFVTFERDCILGRFPDEKNEENAAAQPQKNCIKKSNFGSSHQTN
ncbi:hypothetical protein SADUNF_Sadunf15G0106200 [Salix dunnii]|uniref:GHMP kinase N-terminal domain-containing protein n=1 Tax=Salix dunnii TaxID=1413687 RepID=A0A835JEI9_9ROSI|nr:hypothetical protein SADUNF_Sadunf15G0106200 [Salix dunnii]